MRTKEEYYNSEKFNAKCEVKGKEIFNRVQRLKKEQEFKEFFEKHYGEGSYNDDFLITPLSATNLFIRMQEEIASQFKQEWIPVTPETLPPYGHHVLCYCRIYGKYIGSYERLDPDFDAGNWHDGNSLGVLPPTHYMFLPSPPIEERVK